MTGVQIKKSKKPITKYFSDIEPGQFFWRGEKIYCRPKGALKTEAFCVTDSSMVSIPPGGALCTLVSSITMEAS